MYHSYTACRVPDSGRHILSGSQRGRRMRTLVGVADTMQPDHVSMGRHPHRLVVLPSEPLRRHRIHVVPQLR